jgi:hypothetical protein
MAGRYCRRRRSLLWNRRRSSRGACAPQASGWRQSRAIDLAADRGDRGRNSADILGGACCPPHDRTRPRRIGREGGSPRLQRSRRLRTRQEHNRESADAPRRLTARIRVTRMGAAPDPLTFARRSSASSEAIGEGLMAAYSRLRRCAASPLD